MSIKLFNCEKCGSSHKLVSTTPTPFICFICHMKQVKPDSWFKRGSN